MNIKSIIDNDLGTHVLISEDSIAAAEQLIELLDYCSDKEYTIVKNNDNVYVDESFSNWLFGDFSNKDIKRELQLKLDRAQPCEDAEYLILHRESNQLDNTNPYFFVSAQCTTLVHANCINKLQDVRLLYLSMCKNEAEFIELSSGCFDYLFFCRNCEASIYTLKAELKDVLDEVIDHLKSINQFYPHIIDSRNQIGFRQLSEDFHHRFGIRCSPQAGRDTVDKLKIKLVSDDKSHSETFTCELHTKLKSSDRIYFHPGQQNFAGGKIIVFHIGKHM